MTDRDPRTREGGTDHAEDAEDRVAALFRLAGRPPEPTMDEMTSAREAAREAWQRGLDRRATRRRRTWAAAAALAAGLALAVLWVPDWLPGRGVTGPVATVARSSGAVTFHTSAAPGDGALVSGAVVETADGRVALTLAAGGSLRLDRHSRVRLDGPRALSLERGALYLDSGGDSAEGGEPTAIATPLGVVSDIGTRFEVRLVPGEAGGEPALQVRVRDGAVRVETEDGDHVARGGTELLLEGGQLRRQLLAPHDPVWEWAAETAPVPAIEGRTLAQFLDWVGHERGVSWTVVSPRPELAPEETVLHGSVDDLTPDQALEVVLAGTGLTGRSVDGELRISAATVDR